MQKNVEKENRKPRPAKGGEKRIGAFCLGGLHLVPEVLSQRGSSNVPRRRDAKRRNTRAFSSMYSIQHTPAFRKGVQEQKIKPAPPVAHPCRKGHTPSRTERHRTLCGTLFCPLRSQTRFKRFLCPKDKFLDAAPKQPLNRFSRSEKGKRHNVA